MNTSFMALVEYLFENLLEGSLSDAVIYEFIVKCYDSIQEEAEIPWTGAVEKLWNYLTVSRTAVLSHGQDGKLAFQQGQILAAMEFVKMMQERRKTESELEEDSRHYCEHWYPVFAALRSGKSMTHGELSAAIGLSESSLSQFLHKIADRRYISVRKVGRTKYYRLTGRGQKVLSYMENYRELKLGTFGLFKTASFVNLFSSNALSYGLIEVKRYNDTIGVRYNKSLPAYEDTFMLEELSSIDDQYALI